MIALEWILQMLKIINKRTIEISAFYKFKKDVFLLPEHCSHSLLYSQLQQLLPGFITLTEKHQGCMGLILQILPYLLLDEQLIKEKKIHKVNIDVQALWEKIHKLLQTTRYLSIRIACIPLLGALTRLIGTDKNMNPSFVVSVFQTWARHIHRCVQDDEPDPLRFETLKSYIYLGDLLFPQSPAYAGLPKETHSAIMKSLFDLVLLLQDDDSDIRHHASSITSQIVLGLKSDIFEAKTLELLFQHLSTYYGNEVDYPVSIEAMILGQKNIESLLDYEMNSTKHIFELERSNIYKEDLINIQVAAYYAKPSAQQLVPALAKVHMIVDALSTLSQSETTSTPQIINEFTSRPDVFTAFYRSIIWMSLCIRNISTLDKSTITGK